MAIPSSPVASTSSASASYSSPIPFLLAPSSRPNSPSFARSSQLLTDKANRADRLRRLAGGKGACPIVPALISARFKGRWKHSPWAWSDAVAGKRKAVGQEVDEEEAEEEAGLPWTEAEAVERRERRAKRAAVAVGKVAVAVAEGGGAVKMKAATTGRQPTINQALKATKSTSSSSLKPETSYNSPAPEPAALPSSVPAPASKRSPPPVLSPEPLPDKPESALTSPLPSPAPALSQHSHKLKTRTSTPARPTPRPGSPTSAGSRIPVVPGSLSRLAGGVCSSEAGDVTFDVGFDIQAAMQREAERGRSLGEDEEILDEFGCTQMVLNPPTQNLSTFSSPSAPLLPPRETNPSSPRRPAVLVLDSPVSPARRKPTFSCQPTSFAHPSRRPSLALSPRAGTLEASAPQCGLSREGTVLDDGRDGTGRQGALVRTFTKSNQGSFLHDEMGQITAFLKDDIKD